MKPATVLKSEERREYERSFYEDTRENDETVNEMETLEDVQVEKEKLYYELNKLERKMANGIDVTVGFERLKKKFELIRKLENLIESESSSSTIIKG